MKIKKMYILNNDDIENGKSLNMDKIYNNNNNH